MKMGELQNMMVTVHSGSRLSPSDQIADHLTKIGLEANRLYHELEMTSAYVDTHQDISYSNAHISLHSHDFFELLFCRSCEGVAYLVGADRYQLQKGDIILVPPGVSHRPLLPESLHEPYDRYVIWLSPEFMAFYSQFFGEDSLKKHPDVSMLRTAGSKWESLEELFHAGVILSERKEYGWEAAVIGNTILLLTQIRKMLHNHSLGNMHTEKPELLDKLTTYVEYHYHQPITIGELAKHFFVSSSTISHLFKQKMGVSFYRYVTQRRLIAAKTRIQQGTPLETVSQEVGFCDYSTFYRAFKQEYGIGPRAYRKLQG